RPRHSTPTPLPYTTLFRSDTVAGAVAAAVKARRFLLLTDVAGVLDGEKRLIPELTAAEARRLIAQGTISGGMIPKVETCLAAVEIGRASCRERVVVGEVGV